MAEDMDSSIRKLIETLLRSMGPLTLDEIMLRLPIAQEKLQEVLDGMVKDSVLDLEYVTPVFSKQYIMHQDMQALLAGGESDIQASRLLWLEGTALDINEYFEKFGYALDSWSLRARTESYSAERVNELISDKSIYHGRTIRHKPTYAAAWMIEALHSLRYEEPDKNMQGLVAAVRNGASTEDMIQEALGIDRTIIKQMLKNAEFFCLVGKDAQGKIIPMMGDAEPIDKKEAINRLVDKLGPVSLTELSYSFWFYTTGLEQEIQADRNYRNGDVLYGKIKASQAPANGIIVSS
ncbi:hypothetical protein B1B_00544, partial [mine drainage metagenome]